MSSFFGLEESVLLFSDVGQSGKSGLGVNLIFSIVLFINSGSGKGVGAGSVVNFSSSVSFVSVGDFSISES